MVTTASNVAFIINICTGMAVSCGSFDIGKLHSISHNMIYTSRWTVSFALAFVSDSWTKILKGFVILTLQWSHNERDDTPNHRGVYCLLNRLFRCRSKKTLKLRATGLVEGNPPVDFPHKGPVMRRMFLYDDVIMDLYLTPCIRYWKTLMLFVCLIPLVKMDL